MPWRALHAGWQQIVQFWGTWTNYPEAILLVGAMTLLLLRRKFKACLILAFGVILCFANYFILTEYASLAIPSHYAVGLGAVSVLLLLLLLYQFIHTA